MNATTYYKLLHLTPIEELIDADIGKPGTPGRKAFDESANRFFGECNSDIKKKVA